jgi:hypothetical protein
MPNLGYDWTVRPGRDDLLPVAQGHRVAEASARMLVELILLGEPIAERGELTGPRGRAWRCRLDAPAAGRGDLISECGRIRWEPE